MLCLNLTFNPDKAFIMNMSRDAGRIIKLSVNGRDIVQVRNMKILGRMINAGNTVREHYEKILARIDNRINILKCVTTIRGDFFSRLR